MTFDVNDAATNDWVQKNRWWFYPILIVIVFSTTIFLFFFFGVWHVGKFPTIDVAGMYGDSFGFANALFSSLALAGVVLALVIQTLEFNLAARERKEGLTEQRKIAQAQRDSAIIQAISTHVDLEGSALFHVFEINLGSPEFNRLFRTYDYLLELETRIATLLEKEPVSIDDSVCRRKLAIRLIRYSETMFDSVSIDSQMESCRDIELRIEREIDAIFSDGLRPKNPTLAADICKSFNSDSVPGNSITKSFTSDNFYDDFKLDTARCLIVEAIQQLGFNYVDRKYGDRTVL